MRATTDNALFSDAKRDEAAAAVMAKPPAGEGRRCKREGAAIRRRPRPRSAAATLGDSALKEARAARGANGNARVKWRGAATQPRVFVRNANARVQRPGASRPRSDACAAKRAGANGQAQRPACQAKVPESQENAAERAGASGRALRPACKVKAKRLATKESVCQERRRKKRQGKSKETRPRPRRREKKGRARARPAIPNARGDGEARPKR